ncbi:hypothetical protein OIU76_023425 [Salix suchowensis]|nr:hypothetical protein OIU76_023425 [Salix suchowensis]
MGRTPCCDKNGLKKGPWTPEEDHELISYIHLHGPGNWRSLPKNAALCNPSTLLNLSTLVGSTQALLNPDILRLATTLSSLKQENSDMFLQQLQENQLLNSLLQIQDVPALSSQPSQFQNLVQQVPVCTTSAGPFINQTAQVMQENVKGCSSNPTSTFSCQNSQENFVPSSLNENLVSLPNFYCNSTTTTDPKVVEPGEYSGFQSANNGYQNFSIDSVMPTPLMSQDPLNSSSTYVNSSSTEDERECYSSLLKFEIPESLDIDDFL